MTDIFALVANGTAEEVRALVAAEPAAARVRNAQGQTPLLVARYRSRLDVLAALRAAVAADALDIWEAAALGETSRVAALLDTQPDLVSAYHADGFYPLGLACFFGHPETAALLLARGAAVNQTARNAFAVAPVHAAVAARGHATVAALIAAGADVNLPQQGGFTPLHEAAHQGDRALVELLLAAGAGRHRTTDDGQTPAATARAAGHAELAAALAGDREA